MLRHEFERLSQTRQRGPIRKSTKVLPSRIDTWLDSSNRAVDSLRLRCTESFNVKATVLSHNVIPRVARGTSKIRDAGFDRI